MNDEIIYKINKMITDIQYIKLKESTIKIEEKIKN